MNIPWELLFNYADNLLIPLLLALIGYLIWLSKEQIRKRNDLERQLSPKKYELYSNIINAIYKAVVGRKNSEFGAINCANFDEVFKLRPDMVIYASDEILKKFNEFHDILNSPRGITIDETYRFIGELMLLIRKDMGNSNTKLTLDEAIMPIFIETYQGCNISQGYYEELDRILGKNERSWLRKSILLFKKIFHRIKRF